MKHVRNSLLRSYKIAPLSLCWLYRVVTSTYNHGSYGGICEGKLFLQLSICENRRLSRKKQYIMTENKCLQCNMQSWKTGKQFQPPRVQNTINCIFYYLLFVPMFTEFKVSIELMSIFVMPCTAFMWSLSFVKVFPHKGHIDLKKAKQFKIAFVKM